MERKIILNERMDEERALYNLTHGDVTGCVFSGPKDGESALKEAKDVTVTDCKFSLRYPLWHVKKFTLRNSSMDEKTRAALWYSEDGIIENCVLSGVKAVRECKNIGISDCEIDSAEFGWKSDGITIENGRITSEYLFLDAKNVTFKNVVMHGKYSFQYVENAEIDGCDLNTKDAFWHSKNVTVKNSVVKGEYLGWFSEGLTLINCRISGTQPFCYCANLTLINCTTENCDLSFEYSSVNADINGGIVSVKNPKSGVITADEVGEIIKEGAVMPCHGKVIIRKK